MYGSRSCMLDESSTSRISFCLITRFTLVSSTGWNKIVDAAREAAK